MVANVVGVVGCSVRCPRSVPVSPIPPPTVAGRAAATSPVPKCGKRRGFDGDGDNDAEGLGYEGGASMYPGKTSDGGRCR